MFSRSSIQQAVDILVRLRKALRPLRLPVDLMVFDEETISQWGSLPGAAMYWALKEDEVLHEST
jgi:uncharacterized protein